MHLESTLLTPAELARVLVPLGTTAVISDSHEIGNVLGVAGIDQLAGLAEGLPLDVFFMASSCVPATAFEDAGATIGLGDVVELLDRPHVLGLAEVMDVPAVLNGDGDVLAKVAATQGRRLAVGWPRAEPQPARVDGLRRGGHPVGPRVDHRRRGPRQGCAGDAGAGPRGVAGAEPRRVAPLCSPRGRSTSRGASSPTTSSPTSSAATATSTGCSAAWSRVGCSPRSPSATPRSSPPRHYGLADRGAVAPGYRADVVVVDDLAGFAVHLVLKDGAVVARDGAYLADHPTPALAPREHRPHRPGRRGDLPPPALVLPPPRDPDHPRPDRDPLRGSGGPDPGRPLGLRSRPRRRPRRQHRAPRRHGQGGPRLVAGFGFTRPGRSARRSRTTRTTSSSPGPTPAPSSPASAPSSSPAAASSPPSTAPWKPSSRSPSPA